MLDNIRKMTLSCYCGECMHDITPYIEDGSKIFGRRIPQQKAGIFIYDSLKERILLVQSRGNLWGCPKGTLNKNETVAVGAAREVQEETGIKVDPASLLCPLRPTDNSSYFYLELPGGCLPVVQRYEGNDANAVAWISQSCLKKLIKEKRIKLTFHTRKLLQWLLGWSIYI
jgi:ADP-ribose pyrophosphatase YjhB (NUDIX family)